MMDNQKRTKIKNNKILNLRLDLASFSYTIQCGPGPENIATETLFCSTCDTAGYVHSDRGPSLMSEELRTYHLSRGIASIPCRDPSGNEVNEESEF